MMTFKKIVLVTSIPMSEPVIRNRLLPFINTLSSKNIKVTLVCPQIDNGDLAIFKDLDVKPVNLSVEKPHGFIQRAFKEIFDCSTLLSVAKSEPTDAYLITIPSMFLAFFSPLFLHRMNVFIDIRDLSWEYLSEKNALQRFRKKILKKAFSCSLSFYKLVAVTNSTEFAYVENILKKKPFLVSNGIMKEQFDKLALIKPLKKDQTIVTYVGNVGIAQDLSTLVFAAQQLPNVLFKIVGSGIQLSKIQQLVSTLELKNIELTGRVSWEEVKNYYDATTILYAQLTPDFSGAMPSKLYEYLATGKYVVYGGKGQANETLSCFEHNILIPPCDVNTLVKVIKDIDNNRDEYNELSLKNRALVSSNYVRERTAKKFIEAIENFITSNKN